MSDPYTSNFTGFPSYMMIVSLIQICLYGRVSVCSVFIFTPMLIFPSIESESCFNKRGAPWFSPQPNIQPSDPRWAQLVEARLVWRFDELEEKLHYTFNDPSLLIQVSGFQHHVGPTHRSHVSSKTASDIRMPLYSDEFVFCVL